ncbi:MAG TPA: trigger factor [Anaerolineae bacterium]|nr:trigger factor [Anaerolineae bacterium]
MPKIELRESTGCTKKFHIEIERERFDQEIQSAVKNFKRDVQLPGFRKGKAPENLIIRRFMTSIRQEALKDMIPKVVQEMLDAEGITPVSIPDVSDLEMKESSPVSFMISVEEIPEIDVSGFTGLSVTKEVQEVTNEDVDDELDRIRHMYAKQKEVDRGAREGDILVLNLQKLDYSGVPIIGEKMENHVILLDGQSTPSPEFDTQVLGMKKNEKKTIRFTYDETINNPDIVGMREAYEVVVVKVIENEVPEMNDTFVATLGNFTNLEELRVKTRENLSKQYEANATRKLYLDTIEEFIRQAPFEVPNSMVEKIIQSQIDQIKKSNQDEMFDEKAFRYKIRPDAVRAVQTYLINEAIKKQQGIEVTKEEIDSRIETLAQINDMKPGEMRRKINKDGKYDELINTIAKEKIENWLLEVTSVTNIIVGRQAETSRIVKP